MKFRITQWLDTSNMAADILPVLHGVQANNGGGWAHCHEDGKPLIYKSLEEASAKMDELRERFKA